MLREPTQAGFDAAEAGAATTNLRAVRARLGLTHEAFALRYGLEIETVRTWESGKREPDQVAQANGFAEDSRGFRS